MKRLLIGLAFLCCLQVQAAMTVVHVTTGSVTFSPLVVTIPSTTAGDALLVWFSNTSSTDLATITDNASGGSSTYITANSNATISGVSFSYAQNIAGGITSVTFTVAGGSRYGVIIAEVSGVATSSLLDIASSFTRSFASGSVTLPTVATTNASDVVLGVVQETSDDTTTFTSGDCTVIGSIANSTMAATMYAFYKTETSTGTYSCTVTGSGGTTLARATAAIKLSGAMAAVPTQIGAFAVGP